MCLIFQCCRKRKKNKGDGRAPKTGIEAANEVLMKTSSISPNDAAVSVDDTKETRIQTNTSNSTPTNEDSKTKLMKKSGQTLDTSKTFENKTLEAAPPKKAEMPPPKPQSERIDSMEPGKISVRVKAFDKKKNLAVCDEDDTLYGISASMSERIYDETPKLESPEKDLNRLLAVDGERKRSASGSERDDEKFWVKTKVDLHKKKPPSAKRTTQPEKKPKGARKEERSRSVADVDEDDTVFGRA